MNEKDFGANIRPWLNRSADQVGEMQATRLRSARLRALEAYREPVRLFGMVIIGGGTAQALKYSVFQQALLWLPVLILLAVLATKNVPMDLGEIDAQLLTGELPIDAFLDKDFDAWLKNASARS